jgi:hypothetical protein
MEEFQALPTEEELGEWLEKEAFKDDIGALDQVLEGFKALTTFTRTKRMMMTMSNDAQLQTLLTVMKKDGERGRLWPGLGQEVRVRVEAMTRRPMEITVLDVDPESDEDLVRRAMEKYGEVKRCERMRMKGIFHRVVVNKVKVELVRNEERLPNIIHAFGTTTSADDFATWKMEYRGCPRYCYGCGATSHEARQCGERGIARGRLEKMASVVGEEQGGTGAPLSYAAVLKDPTFLARQKREREEEEKRREERSVREEQNRRETTAQGGEAEWRERAERELERERRDGNMEMELEERGEQETPQAPQPLAPPPPRREVVDGVVAEEAKVAARMVDEEAKVVAGVVTEVVTGVVSESEEAKVAPQLEKGKGESRPPPPPLPGHQEERMPPPASQRGRPKEKMKDMAPGEKRDGTVVHGLAGKALERARSLSASALGSRSTSSTSSTSSPARKRRSSPHSSPRGSSKTSRTEMDPGDEASPSPAPEALRESSSFDSPLPLNLEEAGDSQRQEEEADEEEKRNWADQVEEEERDSLKEEEKPKESEEEPEEEAKLEGESEEEEESEEIPEEESGEPEEESGEPEEETGEPKEESGEPEEESGEPEEESGEPKEESGEPEEESEEPEEESGEPKEESGEPEEESGEPEEVFDGVEEDENHNKLPDSKVGSSRSNGC